MLCRLASYLHAHPTMVSRFEYQPMAEEVYCEVDADWAGDQKSRRSTDGGFEFLGTCVIDGWACTQQSVALSSGESELYAICNGAARVLWTKGVLEEMGFETKAVVGSDSSAARGITARLGTGRVRHLEARHLCHRWLGVHPAECGLELWRERALRHLQWSSSSALDERSSRGDGLRDEGGCRL